MYTLPMTIHEWIQVASTTLTKAGIPSAQLDAELLLANALQRERTYLRAHSDEPIYPAFLPILAAQVQLRSERVPLAYLLGYKEFYGRTFTVTPATLIPRPESEALIDTLCALEGENTSPRALLDVGTGSGILGITAQCELPHLTVTASDISPQALSVAQKNAHNLSASITTIQSDLLTNITEHFFYIVANLPYVDKAWRDTSPELRYEPQTALYAQQDGLALIFKLLRQVSSVLLPEGYVLLEADPEQHAAIILEATTHHNFEVAAQQGYCIALKIK